MSVTKWWFIFKYRSMSCQVKLFFENPSLHPGELLPYHKTDSFIEGTFLKHAKIGLHWQKLKVVSHYLSWNTVPTQSWAYLYRNLPPWSADNVCARASSKSLSGKSLYAAKPDCWRSVVTSFQIIVINNRFSSCYWPRHKCRLEK